MSRTPSGPQTPFQSWKSLVSRFAYYASNESYKYDAQDVSTSPFRSSRDTRESFRVNFAGRSFRADYVPEWSLDTVAAYVHGKTLILAFRGTDPVDPARYLNYMPTDYEERVDDSLQKLAPRIQGDTFAKRWAKVPFVPADSFCSCNEKRCGDTYDTVISRETILGKVNMSYCGLPSVTAIDTARPKDVTKDRWDVLLGGASNASMYSDCKSDNYITYSRLTGFVFAKTSKNVASDEKHKYTNQWTQSVVAQFQKRKGLNIILTGHSLGGSLAFHAYIRLLKTVDPGLVYYVGFDAAVLSNFNDAVKYLPNGWTQNAIHYRMYGDGVSALFGYVPTLTYSRGNKSPLRASFDNLIHGLFVFQKCPFVTVAKENAPNETFGANLSLI